MKCFFAVARHLIEERRLHGEEGFITDLVDSIAKIKSARGRNNGMSSKRV